MNAKELSRMRPRDALLIIKALGLRKKHENILIMRYVEELNSEEISEKLCITPESVNNLVCEARKEFDKYVKRI